MLTTRLPVGAQFGKLTDRSSAGSLTTPNQLSEKIGIGCDLTYSGFAGKKKSTMQLRCIVLFFNKSYPQ